MAGCFVSPCGPAANITWFVNNNKIESNTDAIRLYKKRDEQIPLLGLWTSRSKMEIKLEKSHVIQGLIRIKCMASIYSIWNVSVEEDLRDETPKFAQILGSTTFHEQMNTITAITMVFTKSDMEAIKTLIKSTISDQLQDIADRVEQIISDTMEKKFKEQSDAIKKLNSEIISLKKENIGLKSALDAHEQATRNSNIRIFGIPQTDGENVRRQAIDLITNKLKVKINNADINWCHRVRAKNPVEDDLPVEPNENLNGKKYFFIWSPFFSSLEDYIDVPVPNQGQQDPANRKRQVSKFAKETQDNVAKYKKPKRDAQANQTSEADFSGVTKKRKRSQPSYNTNKKKSSFLGMPEQYATNVWVQMKQAMINLLINTYIGFLL
ncbi:unnamed protein product [Ceutorhynchus assimilis]|uniref:Uncharacterized protein n=1 Tax=Ceutorhynchus assimilis TaxID=467358 RepID=A0A9N9MEL0_9CUCU|nr:unnamed protein product [Ceutorhynchus assimilis]